MIIFDLDGTLADCEHRRHFVDPKKIGYPWKAYSCFKKDQEYEYINQKTGEKWKPDWQAFYEACDKDLPNKPIIDLLDCLLVAGHEVQIWSGRCESVKNKTIEWIKENVQPNYEFNLKMRPIGDSTPDDVLKEKWLDERCKHVSLNLETGKTIRDCHDIEMVFDDRDKVVAMWRRRGITCLQVAEGNF